MAPSRAAASSVCPYRPPLWRGQSRANPLRTSSAATSMLPMSELPDDHQIALLRELKKLLPAWTGS